LKHTLHFTTKLFVVCQTTLWFISLSNTNASDYLLSQLRASQDVWTNSH